MANYYPWFAEKHRNEILALKKEQPTVSNKEIAERIKAKYKYQYSLTPLRKTVSKVLSTSDVRATNNSSWEESKSSAVYEYKGSRRIETLEEAIAVSGADLDLWEVEKWIHNKWEQASNEKGLTELIQVKVWFKRRKSDVVANVIDDFKEELKKFAPKYPKIKYAKPSKEGRLLEISIYDLHLGKLAWKEETGEEYNCEIAEQRFLDAITDLISKAKGFNVERILFPIGNDFFNSDTKTNTTTNGTPQDEEMSWMRTYRLGRQLLVKAIDMLQQIAPVDVVGIASNHDQQRMFYVTDAMQCWYHKSPNVNVNNEATPRKYYQYGECLIGLSHGHNEKVSELPLIMAMEEPKKWAETRFREFHLGHLHHSRKREFETLKENKGVTVRYLRSLSGTDSWHNNKAFKGALQSAEAFIWSKDEGMIGNFTYTVK